MSHCNFGLKTTTMLNINSKSTLNDTVASLTVTTDMPLLSNTEEGFNNDCSGFNPIVGKSSDFYRMKSVDSAICSMFTPPSSLQLSPSSRIGSSFAIYDSTSSSNNNDLASKSRFIPDYSSVTNNLCQLQAPVTNFEEIPSSDSVTLIYPSQAYRDCNHDYNSLDNSIPLQSGYVINKSGSNSENVILWQNNSFRYEPNDKDDRGSNNWTFDDSINFGNIGCAPGLSAMFVNSPGKRPITGGHGVTSQPCNQYHRPQNGPWTGGYGPSVANCTVAKSPTSSNNPWNQALVNQKLGLAPAPVNAMNLSPYAGVTGHTPLSLPANGKKTHGITKAVSSSNGISNVKRQNSLDLQATNHNGHLTAAGDGAAYDTGTTSNSFSYLEKITAGDSNLNISLDKQLFDVLRLSVDDSDNYAGNVFKSLNPLLFSSVCQREERFSRKVFVGGLPPDIDEEEITAAFKRFGTLVVDWPHKAESKSYFPPKGYCFLLFQEELSVQNLMESCIMDENKYYWCVSSPTIKDKPVQIRPWSLADSDFVMDGSEPLDPRKTIFVGGVPRPLRAVELAMIMDRLYGGVCYSGIDTDPELKYPKGAGRVAFSNQQSYISAISARFVQLQHHEIDKRVEVKPYVLDDQMCDECQGARCGGKFAPFFCANVTCLQYYCEQCWAQIHSRQGREYHKPLVKEGADRPRTVPFRW